MTVPGVAIIGCGLIGRKRAGALPGARLVACADLDLARAESLARSAGSNVVAEKRCIVGSALGVPMHARLVARTRIPREEPVREMVRI